MPFKKSCFGPNMKPLPIAFILFVRLPNVLIVSSKYDFGKNRNLCSYGCADIYCLRYLPPLLKVKVCDIKNTYSNLWLYPGKEWKVIKKSCIKAEIGVGELIIFNLEVCSCDLIDRKTLINRRS